MIPEQPIKASFQLSDEEKRQYVSDFWSIFEPLLIKKRMSRASRKTKYKITEGGKTKSRYGLSRIVELKNRKSELSFQIEINPFNWEAGTLEVTFRVYKSRRLMIPKSRVRPKEKTYIVNPESIEPITFLRQTEPVINYITAVELTILDLNLFDSLDLLVDNLFRDSR